MAYTVAGKSAFASRDEEVLALWATEVERYATMAALGIEEGAALAANLPTGGIDTGTLGAVFNDGAANGVYRFNGTDWIKIGPLPGIPGEKGDAGSTIRSGTIVPGPAQGLDGDYWLRTTTGDLYGPKEDGAWPTPPLSLKGPAGADGADGADGSTILSGAGAPSSGTGANGDYYFNVTTRDLYGPKAAGAWPTPPVSLKGDKGDQGDAGADGASLLAGAGAPDSGLGKNGDFYFDTTSKSIYLKSAGAWVGPTSVKGDQGIQGLTGSQGIPGARGSVGPAGPDGPPGKRGEVGSPPLQAGVVGLSREYYTGAFAGGASDTRIAAPGTVVATEDGQALQLVGAAIVCQRFYTPIEAGRTYNARIAYRRLVNPADPAGHSVTVGVAWYDRNLTLLFTTEIDTTTAKTTDGRREIRATITAKDGGGDFEASVSTRYACLFVRTYGEDGTTAILTIFDEDVTDAFFFSPDLGDLSGRISSIESADLPVRVSTLESASSDPKLVTYPTLTDALAATIPASASGIRTLGGAAIFDGDGRTYYEVASNPGAAGFQVNSRWFAPLAETMRGFKPQLLADLPSAALYPAWIAFVSDLAGGSEFVFSDGTNWRRFSDRTVAGSGPTPNPDVSFAYVYLLGDSLIGGIPGGGWGAQLVTVHGIAPDFTSFARAGSRVIPEPNQYYNGLGRQVDDAVSHFIAQGSPANTAVFLLMGSNDLRDVTDPAQFPPIIEEFRAQVQRLVEAGIDHVINQNLPVAYSPGLLADPNWDLLKAGLNVYNADVATALAPYSQVRTVDLKFLLESTYNDPAAYGFTHFDYLEGDPTAPGYVFRDNFHHSVAYQPVIANYVVSAL